MPSEDLTIRRELFCTDLSDTEALAGRIAERLEPGDFVGLSGGLGMGKTAFAGAVIRKLAGIPIEVTSPTYTLIQTYDCAGLEVWHADLYRLEDFEEALGLGLAGASHESHDAIQLVEWPDRLGPYLPGNRIDVALAPGTLGDRSRKITLSGRKSWIADL